MHISATDLKNRLGQYLEKSIKEPVIIEKAGRPSNVVMSFEEFERLSQLEDFYWGMLATKAESEGYLGTDETAKSLEALVKAKLNEET